MAPEVRRETAEPPVGMKLGPQHLIPGDVRRFILVVHPVEPNQKRGAVVAEVAMHVDRVQR